MLDLPFSVTAHRAAEKNTPIVYVTVTELKPVRSRVEIDSITTFLELRPSADILRPLTITKSSQTKRIRHTKQTKQTKQKGQ